MQPREPPRAFAWVQHDAGFREAANLMVQIGLAAKAKNPLQELAALGIAIPEHTSVADFDFGRQ